MPHGWGLRITLETPEGETLTEYGTSSIRTRIAEQDRIVTTKVEAKTDQKFFFRIEGRGPWLNFASKDVRPPPYALSMTILIDGKKLDGSLLVVLLPQYPVMAEGRVIKGWNMPAGSTDAEGEEMYRPHNWVFTDVGIDVRLAQLGLAELGGDKEDTRDADSGEPDNGTTRQNSKKGTIEVVLERFIMQQVPRPVQYNVTKPQSTKVGGSARGPRHSQPTGTMRTSRPPTTMRASQPPMPMRATGPTEEPSHGSADEIGPNVTHQVALMAEGHEERRWPTAQGYYPDFTPYATFRWQYMSRSKLVKLGLSNEDGSKVTPAEKVERERQEEAAACAPSSSSGKLKRKASEDAESTDVVMAETTSEAKLSKTPLGAGRQMVMTLRPKPNTERRWLKSSKQKPAEIEASKDADEGEGGDAMALT